jgi:hypothetical protein
MVPTSRPLDTAVPTFDPPSKPVNTSVSTHTPARVSACTATFLRSKLVKVLVVDFSVVLLLLSSAEVGWIGPGRHSPSTHLVHLLALYPGVSPVFAVLVRVVVSGPFPVIRHYFHVAVYLSNFVFYLCGFVLLVLLFLACKRKMFNLKGQMSQIIIYFSFQADPCCLWVYLTAQRQMIHSACRTLHPPHLLTPQLGK